MDYTLQVGAVTKTLAEWGVVCRGLSEASFAVSSVTLETAETFDAAGQFAYRESAILRAGETVIFRGRFDEPARSEEGPVNRLTYELRDLWWHLSNLPYVETVAASPPPWHVGPWTPVNVGQGNRKLFAMPTPRITTAASTGTATNPILTFASTEGLRAGQTMMSVALPASEKWRVDAVLTSTTARLVSATGATLGGTIATGQSVQPGAKTIADEMEAVIAYAAANGVAVQMGTAASLAVTPPEVQRGDATCATLLLTLRRFAPDTCTQIDHSTNPPTIHFVRRGEATTHDLDQDEDVMGRKTIVAERGQCASEVVISYLLRGSVDGVENLTVVQDVYPPSATGMVENAVVISLEKRGVVSVTQKQELGVRAISPNAQWFWESEDLEPWLREVEWLGEDTITDGGRFVDDGDGGLEPDSFGLVNQVVTGAVPAWESAASGTVIVKAKALNFRYKGSTYDAYDLQTSVQATSLEGGSLVSPPEVTPGDAITQGLAQLYFQAVGTLHYSGTVTIPAAELTLPRVRVGDVINLVGGEAAVRGWDAMNAQVQRVRVDIDRATVDVEFGPPSHLSLGDLQELMQPQKQSPIVAEGNGAALVSGHKRSASSNSPSRPAKADASAVKPWAVSALGVVTPGTINGVIPKIGTVPISGFVGSTPPTLTIPEAGSAVAYAKIVWSITWNASWLGGNPTISEITLAVLTTTPTNTSTDKYVPFCTFLDGVPGEPLFNKGALAASLCGNAADTTTMTGPA